MRSTACRTFTRLPLRLCAVAVFALLTFSLAPPGLRAQTFDATALRQPTDLGMTWLIKAGDDPAYAQTGYDDSKWTPFDPN